MNKKIPADATKVFSTKLFEVYAKEVEQFDGSYKTFEWVRAYDIAKAICIVDDKIIILHEEFPGGNKSGLPGGILEHDEDPDVGVKREVEEETGIKFETFEKILTIGSNIGSVEGYRHCYVARNPIAFGEQHLDAGGEKITLEYITFDQMIEFVKRDEVFREMCPWIIKEYLLPGKTEELRKILFG